jgi:hypothetical protein
MQQSSEVKARPKNRRVLAIAAAVLCATALSQPNLAYAGPHGGGGGGGFHGGGGGGFHGGGFHGGGFGGFHGGGFGGFHGRFAAMHEGFGGRHDGFRERHEGFRDRRGFVGGLGFGYYGYPYGWDYNYPDYGYYDYSQPYSSQTWYYCWDPAGYYPYVTQCNTGWQAVPAS